MSRATLVLTDKYGMVDAQLVFDDGFNKDSPAHQHAQILVKLMDEMFSSKQDAEIVPVKEDSQIVIAGA